MSYLDKQALENRVVDAAHQGDDSEDDRETEMMNIMETTLSGAGDVDEEAHGRP